MDCPILIPCSDPFSVEVRIGYAAPTILAAATAGACNKYVRVGFIEAMWKENLVLISLAAASIQLNLFKIG